MNVGRAVVGAVAATAVAATAVAAATGATPAYAHDAGTEAGASGVVLVGVAGLAWTDVNEVDMPTLHDLAGREAVASLSVRTIRSRTCTADGWLTVGAGSRAIDLEDTTGAGQPDRFCREVPAPARRSDGALGIPGWSVLAELQEEQGYGTEIGLLGGRLAEAGICSTAVGPGAALALADRSGTVHSYLPGPDAVDRDTLSACPVTVVDLGGLPFADPPPEDPAASVAFVDPRRVAAGRIDAAIAGLLASVPDGTAVLIAGVADSAPAAEPAEDEALQIAPSGLRVAVAAGPMPSGDPYGASWLSSRTTRWTGLVQLTDIAATLAEFAGLDDPIRGTVGGPWRLAGPHPASTADTLDELVGTHRATSIFRTQSGPFFQVLGIAQVVVFGGALLWLRHRPASRATVLRAVRGAALAAGAFPVSSFLANLVPWWRFDRAGVIMWSSILVLTVAVAALALAGPWRQRIYGPPGVIAGLTAAVLAVDVSTGGHLQHTSLLGVSPVVAGRFYGFGNIAFALFAAATLIAGAALAQWLTDSGVSRRATTGVIVAIGAAAIVVTGATGAGANVGGTLSTVPGVAVLVLGVAGARITVTRLVAAGALAVVVIGVVAWLDWLRPAAGRTHLGQFVADLVDGDGWRVITRKAGASFGTLLRAPYYGVLVPVAYVVIAWSARGPGLGGLRDAYARWPLLRYAIWAGLLTGATGFAVNDSGIIIPALLLTLGIPLVVSAVAQAGRQAAEPPGSPAPAPHPAVAGPGGPGPANRFR